MMAWRSDGEETLNNVMLEFISDNKTHVIAHWRGFAAAATEMLLLNSIIPCNQAATVDVEGYAYLETPP
jgi:hypothetical protein